MRFSIIIPIYNTQSFLRKCLDSIIRQTYTDFEVILVDDGSIDNSPAICDEYSNKDSRFKTIHQKNSGPLAARKNGLSVAKGDYVCCIDGDDWVSNSYLSSFEKAISNGHNPDVVCSSYFFATAKGNNVVQISYREGLYSKDQIANEIFPSLIQKEDATYFPPQLWAKAIKRDLLYRFVNDVDLDIHVGEDRCIIIPLIYNADSLYVLKDELYYYRFNSMSVMNGKKVFPWNQVELTVSHLMKHIDMSILDFSDQLLRFTTHCLFTSCTAFMSNNVSFFKAKIELISTLDSPVYKNAILKSKFACSKKATFMINALRKRHLYRIWLYSRFLIIRNRVLALS